MNSSSTIWASYYTKTSLQWMFEEAGVVCFGGFVAIFLVYIQFE